MSIFDDYYRNNFWGNTESVSGNGSTMHATRVIRRDLPKIIEHFDIHMILDVACGDVGWWHEMTFDHWVSYLGVDIVPELIERNKSWYGEFGSKRQTTDLFEVMDIIHDPLPRADLIFARDVLVHFSNADIQRALRNIRSSGSNWLMATTFPKHTNEDPFDIQTGQWRPLNLQQLWGLPRPELLINEGCDVPGYEDKSLGMWQLR